VRRLKTLELADNRLGDAGLAARLGALFLSGLRGLGVAQNGVTAGGVTLLTGAPPETRACSSLRHLPARKTSCRHRCRRARHSRGRGRSRRFRKTLGVRAKANGSSRPTTATAATRTVAAPSDRR